MATASDLIKGSLRLLGVIASGETPTAAETADALSALNDMLESWSTESLIVYARVREEFTLTSNDGTYTIGPSGDFNTSRPMRVDNAAIEDQSASPTIEYPLEIINADQWARIQTKDSDANIPAYIHIADGFPLSTIYLYPVPSEADKLVLYSWKSISTFALSSESVTFPPGYARALRYNLAVEIAPEFGVSPSPEVVAIAQESKDLIKRMNVKPIYLECDAAVLSRDGGFDITLGE